MAGWFTTSAREKQRATDNQDIANCDASLRRFASPQNDILVTQ